MSLSTRTLLLIPFTTVCLKCGGHGSEELPHHDAPDDNAIAMLQTKIILGTLGESDISSQVIEPENHTIRDTNHGSSLLMLADDAIYVQEQGSQTKKQTIRDSGVAITQAVPALLAAVWVVVISMLTCVFKELPSVLDLFVLFFCLGIVAITGVGMWGTVEGGGMPVDVWFGWHPVLMTVAYPCLMVLGRWSYITPSQIGEKGDRRAIHRAVMCLALTAMLLGYYGIFKAHLVKKAFFGYDFPNQKWAAWERVVHGWLGYLTIVLTISQAIMGMLKYNALSAGEKAFTFHGILGKSIIILASLTILMAVYLWKWGVGVKILLVVFTLIAASFGTVWPKMNNAQ